MDKKLPLEKNESEVVLNTLYKQKSLTNCEAFFIDYLLINFVFEVPLSELILTK